jgi:CHRD domain-containing protein
MSRIARLAVAALLLSGLGAAYADVSVILTGRQEVPPVETNAHGTGRLKVAGNGAVSGAIVTNGIEGTMAHIHVGVAGQNGPPIITLVKKGDGRWAVPQGAKLTDDQMKSFKSGNLYVNVHSEAHKSGEIRAQLKP